MHQPRRAIIFLVAMMASTVIVGVQTPRPADALTTTIWLNRTPNYQRLADSALSSDGSVGFLASTHSFGLDTSAQVWRSTNSGNSWSTSGNIPAGSWESVATSGDGNSVVALGRKNAASTKSVMVSLDGGDTWEEKTPTDAGTIHDVDVTVDGSHIALATSAGVELSSDGGVTWTNTHETFAFPDQSEGPLSLYRLEIGKTNTSEIVIHANLGNYAVYTEIHGTSITQSGWIPGNSQMISDVVASDHGDVVLAVSPGSSSGATIFLSRDRGSNWTTTEAPGLQNSFTRVAVSGDGTRRIALGYGNPLIESRGSNDSTWTAIETVQDYPWMSPSLSSTGTHFLIGTERMAATAFMQIPTPAPSISGLRYRGVSDSPMFVPAPGGGELMIEGNFFYDLNSVSIGGVSVTEFTRVSDTQITLTLPARSAGPVDVIVTSDHGVGTLAGILEYYQLVAPSITQVSITQGHFVGGSEVTFTGDGFAEVTRVRFGDRNATIVSQSRNEMTVTTPVNRIGVMDITVTNPTGTTILDDAWVSTWVSRSEEPVWSTIHGSSNNPFNYGGPSDGVSSVISDGDGGFYVFGNFEELGDQRGADYAAHWDGISFRPIGEDANGYSAFNRGGSPSTSLFGGQGILTAIRTDTGSLWVGGEFEVEGRPANIARYDSFYGSWWVPSVVPDGRVTSITAVGNDVIVGGDFGALTGVPSSSRLARLTPVNDGVWSGIGSDGAGGSAIKNNGSLFGDATKTVQDVLVGSNGSVLAAGSFQLASTTSGHDLVAEFDGATWRTVLPSTGLDVATSLTHGVIDGVNTTVVGVCTQTSDGVEFDRGRVVTIANGVATTIGIFNDCVRDVAIVGDAIIAAGWFGWLVVDGVTTVRLRNLALFQDSGWTNLNARVPLDSLAVFDGYHLAVSSYQTDSRIASISGGQHMARVGPIRDLVGRATPLTVASVVSAKTDDGVAVTITGTGFTSETDVALENRPAENLVITSETSLRFTAPWSDNNRNVAIYGRAASVSATLNPPSAQRVTESPVQGTSSSPQESSAATKTVTTGTLPTSALIRKFPTARLVPTGTRLHPKAPLKITASGFSPSEEVWFIVASTPRRVGSALAASDGTVSSKVTLPSNLVGQHTLIAWSPTTGRGVRQPITISMTLKAKRATTASTLLKKHNIAIPKKSSLKLSSQTPKTCRATSSIRLTTRTKGTCRVTITITPQKGKASTKRLSIIVT